MQTVTIKVNYQNQFHFILFNQIQVCDFRFLLPSLTRGITAHKSIVPMFKLVPIHGSFPFLKCLYDVAFVMVNTSPINKHATPFPSIRLAI